MIIENGIHVPSKDKEALYENYRIRDWVDPLTGVEYLIIETKYSGTEDGSGGVSMTPRLNPDGTLRVRNISQNK